MVQNNTNSAQDVPVLEVAEVFKSYGARLVLKGITLRIPEAQALCLCGINGAGKSTLLRIIAGLLHPNRGDVRISGHDVRKNPALAQPLIGVISHKSMLYDDLTVAENLQFYARIYGVTNTQARVSELLEDVSLAPYRHEKTRILSRGLLQRLTIARALVHRPRLLLADEPFTRLDLEAGQHLVRVLQQFRRDGGTIIMTTHDIHFGLQSCDRVVVLDQARTIFDAPVADLEIDGFAQDYLAYARKNK